jgi:hypothetical protein
MVFVLIYNIKTIEPTIAVVQVLLGQVVNITNTNGWALVCLCVMYLCLPNLIIKPLFFGVIS